MDSSMPERQTTTHSPRRLQAVAVAFMVLISGSVGFVGGWLGAYSHDRQAGLNTSEQKQIIANESQLISEVARTVGESVVSVNVTAVGQRSDFFGFIRDVEQQSAGTGIILNEDGVIVTNRHVVPAGVTEVSVTLSDGTELENVEVIGRTNESDSLDIAFLKVNDKEGKTLKAAALGDSSSVNVGAKVIAIGNALGQFQNTVTSGIISGFGRSLIAGDEDGSETLQNLFQTDAAINEGNSGGPLVNINGQVIGINTAIAGAGAENIGFAIPIDDIKGLIASVMETGKVERPFLGVRYISLTDAVAEEFDLDQKRGAYLAPAEDGEDSPILTDSPAAKAGLKEGDIIVKVNGTTVDDRHSLTSLIGRHRVGQEITVTIHRDGKDQEIKATLEAQTD